MIETRIGDGWIPAPEFINPIAQADSTVPLTSEQKVGNLTVLSVAPLIGEAMKRIHEGRSVGELFQ